ncbi:uncharacterized protein LOC116343737 [Contarinia nasturtii]|uniref:uncharacterized protein LOC116343737 n=1 Tax=Contarinia nasturtii TaxID=265458 RepID=UPI0012D4B3B3|nr:uncharacterized protein LOC116343737 [Contarinia nasturtii]
MSHPNEPIAKRLRTRNKITEQATKKPQELADPFLKLNEDCLNAVFEYLDVESLCRTADVCNRSRLISEQVFKRYYRNVWRNYYGKQSELRRVLCKFGHLITTSKAFSIVYADNVYLTFDDYVKYSTNLESLTLSKQRITCKGLATLIPRLKYLELDNCTIDYEDWETVFKECTKLEVLIFKMNTSGEFLVQTFPKLIKLEIECVRVSPATLASILRLNPQIKQLCTLAICHDAIIDAIVENALDLEELKIYYPYGPKESRIRLIWSLRKGSIEGLLKLTRLKKLTLLHLDIMYVEYTDLKPIPKLMEALSNENIPLEKLELQEFSIDSDDIVSLTSLKTLRYIKLAKVVRMTDADLIALTAELPLLSSLHFNFPFENAASITGNGLFRMVQLGNQLEHVSLDGNCKIEVTTKSYQALLKAGQSADRQKKIAINIENNHKIFVMASESSFAKEKTTSFRLM